MHKKRLVVEKMAVIFSVGFYFLTFSSLLFASPSEKEYYGVVALVDVREGRLGILEESDGQPQRRMSFQVDTKTVDIVNPTGQDLSFDEIKPGDSVEVDVEIDGQGVETVTFIRDMGKSMPSLGK